MKKFTLSVASILAIGTYAMAGGDIAPVEPVVEVETPVVDKSGFYVGLGYSYMKMNNEHPIFATPGYGVTALAYISDSDITGDALSLVAGYNFNQYIGVEGRYAATFGDLTFDNGSNEIDYDGDMSNIALYLKPMYPLGGITLYGLLGYGEVTVEEDNTEYSESGFQWGLGANYAVNENMGVFVDYTRLYDDNGFDTVTYGDYKIDSINVGLTYTF